MTRFIFLFVLCISHLGVGWGASDPQGRLPFRSYGREAGLKNLRVNLLLQDKQGFIWVGTDNGLHRFDGQHFQEFGIEHGLPSSEVNALQLDSTGGIWVGTTKGPARWNGDRFESDFKGYPAKRGVEEMTLGPDNDLWIATHVGIFKGSTTGFVAVPGWTGEHVNALALDSDKKTMWIGTKHAVWTWDAVRGWLTFVSEELNADSGELDRLSVATDGQLWMRTSRAYYVLKKGAKRFTVLPELPRADTFLSRLHMAPDGAVWIPTEKGIYRYQNGNFTQISLPDGLPTDFARALLIDREGTLWCGSLGLHRIMGRGAWRSHTPKEGLPASVWTIFRDHSGLLWSGTDKGLAQSEGAGWRVVAGSESNAIRTMVETPDHNLIFGGEPYQLLCWDRNNRRVQKLPALPGTGRKVLSLLMDSSEQLWIGTYRAGLIVGKMAGGKWTFEPVRLPGASADERVSHVMQDRGGRIWATSNAGLLLLENGHWQRYTTKEGLASSDVLYVAESHDGEVWVSYRDKRGTVSRFSASHGHGKTLQTISAPRLPPYDIYLIGEDSLSRLWVGTNFGMDLLVHPRATQGPDTHFGVEQGLIDEESNAMAFFTEANGNTWVGTRGGLAHFESAQFAGDPPPTNVAVLSARIGSVPFSADLGKKIVSHENNNFEIAFAALSFVDSTSVKLETRLLGLEETWQPSTSGTARYPGLAPGVYSMEMRARFGKNNWGTTTILKFEILPPWWQTWWFKPFFVLSIAALIVLFEWRRVRNLTRRTIALEAIVTERTKELEAANIAMREQSLTDPLTGLRNRRYLTETINEQITLADRADFNKAMLGVDPRSACNDLILIILDIDHFKFINDSFGHPAGDKVIQQVAAILKDCARESDTVVRWGGEEFVIVAHQTCFREVSTLLERIRGRFEAHQFDLGNDQYIQRTCSIGFAFYPFFHTERHRLAWEQLIWVADQCLYVAKRSGRNMWVGLSPSDESYLEAICERLQTDIAGMVRDGWLEVKTSVPLAQLKWDFRDA